MLSKKRMKKGLHRTLTFCVSAALLLAMSAVALDVQESDAWEKKISTELWNVMDSSDEDELIPVTVWLDDTQVQNRVEIALKNEKGMDPAVYENDEKFQSQIAPKIVKRVEQAVGYEAAHKVSSQIEPLAAEQQEQILNASDADETSKAETEFEGISLAEKAINAEIDRYVTEKQNLNKREYTALNQNIIESIDSLSDENIIFTSKYTANILMNLTREEITNLARSNKVLDIGYYINLEAEEQTSTELPKVDVPYVRDTLGYRGSASVPIGVIEVGRYSSTRSQLSSAIKSGRLVYRQNGSYSPAVDEHASNVVSLIVGPTGVVPNAQVYQTSANSDALIRSALELLLNDNVRVINMSLASNTTAYSDIDRYVDNFILINNVTCVVAAGNNSDIYGDKSTNVVSPGRAINAITVGNANTLYGKGLHVSSSYTCDYKPDVVAPGCFYIPGSSHSGVLPYDCGTSFAAPIVTGIVAQVIEAGTSSYKYNPAYLKSVIVTGSDYGAIAESFIGSLPTDSMGGGYNYNNCPWMRTKSGFGLVNARKSVEVARSGNVISISKYTGTSVSAPTKQFTKTVTVPSGKKLRASFSPNVLPPNGSIPIEYSLDEFGIKNAKSGIYNSRTTAGWTMAGEMNSATSSSQDYVLCGTQRKGSAAGYMTWRFI